MSRVLITGGAGFIGCRLASALLESGASVDALDNLHPQVHDGRGIPVEFPRDARFIPGDVTAVDSWNAILEATRPTTIVHLAAETGTGQSLSRPTLHAGVNVLGTAAMLEALENSTHRPVQILLASSRAVYGDGAWETDDGRVFYPGHRSTEMLKAAQWDHRHPDGSPAMPVASHAGVTVPHPTNVYAATKLAQEHLLSAWCQARDVNLSVLRLQNVFGPGQSVTNAYTGVLTFFARTAIDGGTIEVFEDGAIVRDFVFVGDVVAAMAAAINKPETRLLDIGSGRHTTVAEVAALVARICGAPTPVVSSRYRHGDVRAAWCEIDDTRNDLGYKPAWSLEDGVAALLDWIPDAGGHGEPARVAQ